VTQVADPDRSLFADTMTEPMRRVQSGSLAFQRALDQIGRGEGWSGWIPLEVASRAPAPCAALLYEIRVRAGKDLVYVGQCGARSKGHGLRGRMGDLGGVHRSADMPYNDPHTAAPCLRALHQHGHTFDVRFAPTPDLNEQERKALETVRLFRYRHDHGYSPIANFGGMPAGCTKSGPRSKGVRGVFRRSDPVDVRLAPRPWPAPDAVLAAEHWTAWGPLDDGVALAQGVYRIAGPHGTVYVGQAANVTARIREHAQAARNPARTGKYALLSTFAPLRASAMPVPGGIRDLLETEDHVLGAVILTERRVPDVQYLDAGRSRTT